MSPSVRTRDMNDVGATHLDYLLTERGMHLLTVAGPVTAEPCPPERRLAAAILRQAFEDLGALTDAGGHRPAEARSATERGCIERRIATIRADARAWIASEEEPGEQPFSCATIVAALGFDLERVRRASARAGTL